jgi:hypothetical protein
MRSRARDGIATDAFRQAVRKSIALFSCAPETITSNQARSQLKPAERIISLPVENDSNSPFAHDVIMVKVIKLQK